MLCTLCKQTEVRIVEDDILSNITLIDATLKLVNYYLQDQNTPTEHFLHSLDKHKHLKT